MLHRFRGWHGPKMYGLGLGGFSGSVHKNSDVKVKSAQYISTSVPSAGMEPLEGKLQSRQASEPTSQLSGAED